MTLRKSFTINVDHAYSIKDIDYESEGGGDKGPIIRAILVGAIISHSLGAMDYIEGIPNIRLISTRISLVFSFR